MSNENNDKSIIISGVELSTKYSNETFSKKAKPNNAPDPKDIIDLIKQNTVKKQGSE